MKSTLFSLLLWLLLGSMFGCFSLISNAESLDEIAAIERAHVASDEVRKNFKKVLAEAMAQGGPAKALPGCRVEAPKIPARAQGKPQEILSVGRTSLKLRSPKNAPPTWTKPYLEKYAGLKPTELPKHEIVQLGKGHFGYLEPIFVEPICLNCHGSHLSSDVQKAIHQDYPDDQAVGFNAGDFRGFLWVELKK